MKSLRFLTFVLIACVCFNALPAQDVANLDARVSALEGRLNGFHIELGGAAFLFGAFCALWAQNTGRSSWAWFFLGFIFSVFAVIALLVKNSRDKEYEMFIPRKAK